MRRNLIENMRSILFISFLTNDSETTSTIRGSRIRNTCRIEFLTSFVTKNGILRFSASGLIKWSWVKNSKWNHPQFGGSGSENLVRLDFRLLFVTKNGILRFFSFQLDKTIALDQTILLESYSFQSVEEGGDWDPTPQKTQCFGHFETKL